MAAETWQFADPRRPRPDHVLVDHDSAQAIEQAVHHLSLCRSPMNQGDGALRLHVLASLIAQAQAPSPTRSPTPATRTTPGPASPNSSASAPTPGRRSAAHQRTTRVPIDPD
jgi:hypothetical protein